MSKHNARVGCPSAKTIHKILMRGVRGRSRTSLKVYVPLSAYPEQPPVFTPPGKPLWNMGWLMPSVDGCEVTIQISDMSANFDPRTDQNQRVTPYVTSERDCGTYKMYDYHECIEHTERDGDTVSIRDADPIIMHAYLKREAWFDRYVHSEPGHGIERVPEHPWVDAITGAVYGWFAKGASHEIVGDYLVFEPTVKSCYLSRVRAFSRELAAALMVCAAHGVKVRIGRGGAW
jgi:hypothetical protein